LRDPKKLPLVCGVAVVTLGALVADYAGVTDPASAGPATRVVASNGKFTPALMDARVGAVTTLNLTSSQGAYALESAGLGIATTMITPGKVTSVSFTPKTAGTFVVRCTVNCGRGHDQMVLTVNVVP
jgi:heme/copper-type cytochrome/quinol oxidase subunit 2